MNDFINWAIREKGEYVTLAEWLSKERPTVSEKAKRLSEGDVRLRIGGSSHPRIEVDASQLRGLTSILSELLHMAHMASIGASTRLGLRTVDGRKLRLHVEIGEDIYHMRLVKPYLQKQREWDEWDEGMRLNTLTIERVVMEAVSSIVSLVEEVLGDAQGIPEDDLAKLKEIVDQFGRYVRS